MTKPVDISRGGEVLTPDFPVDTARTRLFEARNLLNVAIGVCNSSYLVCTPRPDY